MNHSTYPLPLPPNLIFSLSQSVHIIRLSDGSSLFLQCREMGTACSEDQECCSSHCKLQCQKSLGGKCYRKCSDCKHLNDICHTNDDCCSNKCAPDRLDPYAPHTCTDEEPSQESYEQQSYKQQPYKMMAADTGDLEVGVQIRCI